MQAHITSGGDVNSKLQIGIYLFMTVFHTHSAVGVRPTIAENSLRSAGPLSYKEWSKEQMVKAVEAVTIHPMSIRQVSPCYNVPKSTLGD